MSKLKLWLSSLAVAVYLVAAVPSAHADAVYFDNGVNSSTGIGLVYESRDDGITVVWWYDTNGNYGVAWYQ